MKIFEVCSPLKTYLATVRVVLESGTTTARTTLSAESPAHAYLMLSRLFGVGNVLTLIEVIKETPQTDQIHLDELFTPQNDKRQVPYRKIAQTRFPQVMQQRQQQQGKPESQAVSTGPVAEPIKRELVRDKLTKQLVRQGNIVKPTVDDLQIAKSRAETQLKRANLEFERAAEEQLRRLERSER